MNEPDPIHFVNPLQGTDSTFSFSTGNTLPLIALPHGLTHWSPQTGDPNSNWFFNPNDRVFSGIRATHQPSPWMGDYGCFVVMPQSGELKPEAWERTSAFRPETTRYAPHAFQIELLRENAVLDFAPTQRCALLSTEWRASSSPPSPSLPAKRRLLVDLFPEPGNDASKLHWDKDANRIFGYTRKNCGGVPENYAFYFVIALDVPIADFRIHESEDGHRVGVLEFAAETSRITAKMGTSFIGIEQAALNLACEIGDRTLKTLQAEAAEAWNRKLGRFQISGASNSEKRTFYSCLYRTLLFPRRFDEPDAQGNPHHYSPYTGKIEPGILVADNGFWDTSRTVYPLLSLAYPELLGEILEGWLNAYRESGWLPEWSAPGHHSVMIGSFSQAIFADAIVKGIEGFDRETAFRAIVKSATVSVPDRAGYGREALAEYDALGYVPCDRLNKAASRTLDYAYTDYCIAQAALALGHTEPYERFRAQSERWRNVWDEKTQFFRGRLASGEWQEPFDEYEWGGPFVEGSAHQFRFSVPHNPAGLAEQYGGAETMARKIEEMAAGTTEYRIGSYGQTIHEMTEMAVVRFGQYAHSNQPVHGVLSMAAAVGFPQITDKIVHRILTEYYTPTHLPGDEDNGEMSAWYVLSALGLYPLASGSGEYVLNAPLFSEVRITLPHGKELRVVNRLSSSYQWGAERWRVTFNGNPMEGVSLAHALLREGGTLEFTDS